MDIQNRVFEVMCEFALSVEILVKNGWTLAYAPGDRYASPKLIVYKGRRNATCYDEGDLDKLLPVAEGVFDDEWVNFSTEASRAYDEGFRNCKEGWCSSTEYNTQSEDYWKGYRKGWNDAKSLGLHPQDRK